MLVAFGGSAQTLPSYETDLARLRRLSFFAGVFSPRTLGFLKKTLPGRHGWTEFEKMGLLGRTDGEPVSFYVQVIPIGKKPAARSIAVGAKFSDNNGQPSYNW